jgi:hypothetical protein
VSAEQILLLFKCRGRNSRSSFATSDSCCAISITRIAGERLDGNDQVLACDLGVCCDQSKGSSGPIHSVDIVGLACLAAFKAQIKLLIKDQINTSQQ